jgi:putative hemolysin
MKTKHQSARPSTAFSLSARDASPIDTNVAIETLNQRRTEGDNNRVRIYSNPRPRTTHSQQSRHEAPLCDPVAPGFLEQEIGDLPDDNLLVHTDQYSVFVAKAPQIPAVLQEIGRLRESTFRNANEGTGRAIDLDGFDSHYDHLFLWNEDAREIVGAYRLGRGDEIWERLGSQGLYTNTLFDFKPDFFGNINPALELGRTFVRDEYQKSFPPLFLLWKGIAEYVVRNPRYKILFGPVSISDDYHPMARKLIADCLSGPSYRHDLATLVRARNPFRAAIDEAGSDAGFPLLADIESVSSLISEIDSDQRGIPILLKQYLKLGGKVLGFNLDPDFNNALDALILVDLTSTDNRLLERLMGEAGVERFFDYHSIHCQLAG